MMLVLAAVSFWAGRKVEREGQLGQVLALAPALDDLRAATATADSLGMEMMLRMGQRAAGSHRHRGALGR